MGNRSDSSRSVKNITPKQAQRVNNQINPNYAYSEWYYVIDEVTGAKKKLRKTIKPNQRRKRKK